ncbi:MAG: DUF5615 family PIN-like protein [Chloroflexota bacterium]
MIRFLADEDFDNRIIRGVLRRLPKLDLIRVQDTEVATEDDPIILEWASLENRVLLSHDVNTMTAHFKAHLANGFSSPGVLFVSQSLPVGFVIDELVLIATYSLEGEYRNQMNFIPFD